MTGSVSSSGLILLHSYQGRQPPNHLAQGWGSTAEAGGGEETTHDHRLSWHPGPSSESGGRRVTALYQECRRPSPTLNPSPLAFHPFPARGPSLVGKARRQYLCGTAEWAFLFDCLHRAGSVPTPPSATTTQPSQEGGGDKPVTGSQEPTPPLWSLHLSPTLAHSGAIIVGKTGDRTPAGWRGGIS